MDLPPPHGLDLSVLGVCEHGEDEFLFDGEGYRHLLLVSSDKKVANFSYLYVTSYGLDALYVTDLYVDLYHRRQGIVKYLMTCAEMMSKARGLPYLCSECVNENTVSQKFYENFDFKVSIFVSNFYETQDYEAFGVLVLFVK